MKLTIICRDIDNSRLPAVYSFDEVKDIKDIFNISIGPFLQEKDREDCYNKFPKSYKAHRSYGHAYKLPGISNSTPVFYVSFEFDTFYTSKVTGAQNEAAEKRRLKVIAKIKALLAAAND